MQIKIEIEVQPEELRRFLGLPDVSGIQEDVVAFLRDKIGAASGFDASQFVRSNFDVLRKTPAWKKFTSRLRINEDGEPQGDDGDPESAPAAPPRRRKPRARKRAAKKTATASDTPSDQGAV
ncbi:DUF6489 family protein [Solimonas soli]|uniref:DUF6489 family protein n=1 Tax=Solimonas soli TaxID=413479 RepID=UPI0004BA03A3|nr:DUF6489 family protein [Solimonas soli]